MFSVSLSEKADLLPTTSGSVLKTVKVVENECLLKNIIRKYVLKDTDSKIANTGPDKSNGII